MAALRLVHLYPDLMSVYGDRGNVLTLMRRAAWRQIDLEVHELSVGDNPDATAADLIFFGGGQDREQAVVSADFLQQKGQAVREAVDDGAALLSVCGGYQLLGQSYTTVDGQELPGAGLFDVRSVPGPKRHIGNVLIDTDLDGERRTLVGFENHSGRTYLGPSVRPLGRVIVGAGNNGEDHTEGALYKNSVGCYLHGSLLPKNPWLADRLLASALRHRLGRPIDLPPLDDRLEQEAHSRHGHPHPRRGWKGQERSVVAPLATVVSPAPAVDRMRRLAQAALVVMTGFVLSRILGAVRNIVIAAHFGTGTQYDAYVAAIAVPDLVFQVLVGGAVGSAFIPVFKRYLAHGEQQDAWRLTSSAINAFALVAIGTSALLAVFARPIMDVWVAGQDAQFRDLVASLTRILLISPAVFAVSTFCSSVLNSYHRFAIAAMAPLLYNLAIIAAAWGLSGPLGIYGLALGAVVGAFLHLLIQLPFCLRLGMRWRPIVDLRHPGVREVARLFAPRVLGLGVVQFNQVLSAIVLASFLGAVSIGYLNYAWQLIMMPLALAMAVGTAVFPTLSEESALENSARFEQVFLLSLRMILFLTIPASIGLIVLGEPIIRLFFQHGQFDSASTIGTASAMVFYALGLTGHATVEIVDRVFYARHDTRTPVLAAVLAVCVNVAFSLVLMQTGLSFRGLALANSIAALAEAAVLTRFILTHFPGLDLGRLATPALRILAASLVMGLPVAWLANQLDPLLSPYGTPGQALVLVVCVSAGALLYGLVSLAFRSDELNALRRLVRR